MTTRWNSSFTMATRFIELHGFITKCIDSSKTKPKVTVKDDEMGIVKDCLPLLKVFLEVTTILSGAVYSTSGQAIPLIAMMKEDVQKQFPISTIGSELKEALLSEMERCFKEPQSNSLLAKATVMDPRFRGLYLSNEVKKKAIEELKLEVAALNKPETPVSLPQAHPTDKKKSVYDSHIARFPKNASAITSSERVFEKFLGDDICNVDEDVLKFFKTNYNQLESIAMKYLALPASSVASERVASALNLTVPSLRGRLKDEKIVSCSSLINTGTSCCCLANNVLEIFLYLK